MFEENHQVLSYADSEIDLEIFYYFILNPFTIPPSERAKKKLGKATGSIKIEPKRTYVSNSKFIYVPERHNIQFLRAQKMLYAFMRRKNLTALKIGNPYFIDIFYKVASSEVFDNERCRVDMNHVLMMMQYFLVIDPQTSIKNIVKYHLCHELLGNIEITLARELLISLLTPGDMLYKIQDRERQVLVDYWMLSNFSVTIINSMVQFKIQAILGDKLRTSKDDKIKSYIKELEKRSKFKVEGKTPKNMILSFFHSLFNMKATKRHTHQPEELFTTILDIDFLASYKKQIQGTGLARMNTIGNLSAILDDLENDSKEKKGATKVSSMEEIFPISRSAGNLVEATEKDIEEGTVSPVLEEQNQKNENAEAFDHIVKRKKKKWEKKFRGIIRFVMCFNLFLNRPQKMTKFRKDKWTFNFNPYPENIQASNDDIKAAQLNPKLFFEKCAKIESKANKVIEVIHGCLTNAILHKNNFEFMKAIRQNVSDPCWVQKVFFSNERLIFELIKTFIVKIQFHLENKTLFFSGYWAGKTIIQICKEM